MSGVLALVGLLVFSVSLVGCIFGARGVWVGWRSWVALLITMVGLYGSSAFLALAWLDLRR